MQDVFLNDFQIHSNTQNLGYVVQYMEGVSFPSLRQTHYPRAGENGAIVSNLLYDGRTIHIFGTIFSDSATQFQTRRRAFMDAIALVRDAYSVPTPITLKMTTLDSLAVQIDCYIEDFSMKHEQMHGQDFMLQLYAPNPAFLSQALSTAALSRGSGGGAIYPFIYPMIYGADTGGMTTATNIGTMETWPLIYLNGPLTNPIIQNTTLNRFLDMSLTLVTGDQLVIDPYKRTMITNGENSVIGNKTDSSLFWWLAKGVNDIELFTDDNADIGSAQVTFRSAYVGL